jgi:transcription initiation factor IIF auxiliary subunit
MVKDHPMIGEVKFRTYSMSVGKKQEDDWYEWCVFVDESPEILDKIRCVEYVLHPTFPNPIRRVSEQATRFALFSSGWGGFRIGIDVEWKDGSHTKTDYMLALAANGWPKKDAPTDPEVTEASRVYGALFSDKFRWRRAETVTRITGIPEDKVKEILIQLQEEELVRKADFLSFEKKELWAPTAVVGLSPRV